MGDPVVSEAAALTEYSADIVARKVVQGYEVTKDRYGSNLGTYSETQFSLLKKAHPDARVLVLE
jgi:hypothetical protein